jgi:hypothetical protein
MKPVSPIPQKPDPVVPPKLTSPAASPSNQPLPPDTVPTTSPPSLQPRPVDDQKPKVSNPEKPVGKDVNGHLLYAEPSGKIYYTDRDGVKIYVK